MTLPYTIDEQTKTITILSSMSLSILPPMDLTMYSFVINSGATLDTSGINLTIIDLSGSGNIEVGNQILTITDAKNSEFSGVISNPSSYNLSDIIIDNSIATINFAEPCSIIDVGTYVNVFNSSVSIFNNDYQIVSFSGNSATATCYNWVPNSSGGSINKIDDVMLIREYKLSGIFIENNIATIYFTPDGGGDYPPISVGKIVTVVNSSVSIFNDTYTIISSSEISATAVPNWILRSNGGSLSLKWTKSLILSGGTLTLSGINTYNGETHINSGKLIATNSSSVGTGSGTLFCTGGDLLVTNTFTINNPVLTFSPTFLPTTISAVTGKTVIFANGIFGRTPIMIGDANNKGTVIFSNQYYGALTIYDGVSAGFNGVGTVTTQIAVPSTTLLETAGTVSISGVISGGGDINVLNGDTSLSGDNKDLIGGKISVSGKLTTGSNTALGSITSLTVDSDSILDLSTFTPEQEVVDVAPQNVFDIVPLEEVVVPVEEVVVPLEEVVVPAEEVGAQQVVEEEVVVAPVEEEVVSFAAVSFAAVSFVSFAAASIVRRTKIQLTIAPRTVVKAGVKKIL